MPISKVTIGLILRGNLHYLKLSLGSLVAQDYPNLEILVRDQSDHGEAYEYLQNEMPDVFAKLNIEKAPNVMHSGGHNALIRKMTGDWCFCASNDMWYPPDFISKAMAELEKPENKEVGSASPKLMRWDFKVAESDLESSKTHFLDSVGIGLGPCHKFTDKGQGQEDKGQYDHRTLIFGASAAAGFYKKSALDDVAWTNDKGEREYFDETIHYKNDAELAYRLQWAGHKCLFIPSSKVWHDRQASTQSGKSVWTKQNSYFGQLVTVRKNWSPDFSLIVKLMTGLRQAALWAYAFLLDRSLLKARADYQKLIPLIDQKRAAMPRRVKAEEIERLMG